MTHNNSKNIVHRGVKYPPHFISAPDAGKLFSYTPDYITKLAREEKIEATRVGNRWYINPTSLKHFIEENEKHKKRLHEEIRRERLREQKLYAPKVTTHARTALTQTFAILAIGIIVGLGGYTFQNIESQEANVLTAFAKSLHSFISPQEETQVVTAEDTTPTVTTYTSLIIAPDEVFTESQVAAVRDSFSDDVSISVDPLNPDTGLIVPHFRDRDGTEYRYLIAPIQTKETNL